MDAMQTNLELCPSPDGRHGKIWSLAWSPHPCHGAEHMLASCGDNAIVWHYRNSVWSQFMQLDTGTRGHLKACAWRLDGVLLATGGCDSKITLWKYKESDGLFERIVELPVPREEIVKSLSWGKKGLLLSCTNNGCISIVGPLGPNKSNSYHVKCRAAVPEIAEVSCAEWHPDGIKFALGGFKTIKVYRAEIGSDEDTNANGIYETGSLISHDGGINGISFWIDGSLMVAAGTEGKLQFLGLHSSSSDDNTRLGTNGNLLHRGVMCCDWSRCCEDSIGYLIASGSIDNGIEVSVQYTREDDNTAQYRHVTKKVNAHDGPVTNIKWHHRDPRLLASTGLDGAIKIWRVTGSVPYRSNQLKHHSSAGMRITKQRR